MEEIYELLKADLGDIEKVIQLLEALVIFGKENIPEGLLTSDDSYIQGSVVLHRFITEGQQGSVKIPGTLMLYLGGRFEDFVRVLIEELSVQVAAKYGKFDKLPKVMQDSLIQNTSEVIASPRKYGFAEGARDTFIKNLSDNIHTNSISHINHQCLSITTSNMRPDIISELFAKVGLKEVWKRISEQAKIKIHFGVGQSQQAESECKKYLDDFMESRNKIAHPSGTFTWPSTENLKSHIIYFKTVGLVLLEICQMHIAAVQAPSLDA